MTKAVQSRPPQYYLYGDLPVKMELTPSGGLRVSVFDPATRTFQADSSYRSRVLHDRDNLARELSEQEFETWLRKLQKRYTITRRVARRFKGRSVILHNG